MTIYFNIKQFGYVQTLECLRSSDFENIDNFNNSVRIKLRDFWRVGLNIYSSRRSCRGFKSTNVSNSKNLIENTKWKLTQKPPIA